MKEKLFFYIACIFLIKIVLSEASTIDLEKYQKIIHESPLVIFNSTDFKIDEEIYFKISGYFIENYIEYRFCDTEELSEISNKYSENVNNPSIFINYYNFAKVNNNLSKKKSEEGVSPLGYEYYERYYTIKKTKENFKSGTEKGDYLVLFIYMDEQYIIENSKKNEGLTTTAKIILIVVAVVVVIAGLIICYCIRKRKQAAVNNQNNQVYSGEANINNNNNVGYNNNATSNRNIPYNNNAGYNNNPAYNNNATSNRNIPYNNNAGYNNNPAYNNNPVYNNNEGYANNVGYNNDAGYAGGNNYNMNNGY